MFSSFALWDQILISWLYSNFCWGWVAGKYYRNQHLNTMPQNVKKLLHYSLVTKLIFMTCRRDLSRSFLQGSVRFLLPPADVLATILSHTDNFLQVRKKGEAKIKYPDPSSVSKNTAHELLAGYWNLTYSEIHSHCILKQRKIAHLLHLMYTIQGGNNLYGFF